MVRVLAVLAALVVAVAATRAAAQDDRRACARDVHRYCRAQIDSGDMAVLACLQQNRAKLTRACARTLADHGR